ncbi:MAG: 2-dehydro-3-deoxy-6-phosphogalactonate aldolase, partial [Pseudomonadota bacterium]
MIDDYLGELRVVAILRGITPEEAADIGTVLYNHGVRCVEVPLNSPQPLDSIARLRESLPSDCLVGAGTVLREADVRSVAQAGGQLVVTPNVYSEVITASIEHGLDVLPGFATASEAFHAIRLGATRLKLFPASTYGVAHLQALAAVLPAQVRVLAVGGIGAEQFKVWAESGAHGFGVGSELYRAGDTVSQVESKIS